MKISVNDSHIQEGHKRSICFCPIALALKECLGHRSEAVVGLTEASVYQINRAKRNIYLPKKASNFIEKFDKGFPVKPFSFYIAD